VWSGPGGVVRGVDELDYLGPQLKNPDMTATAEQKEQWTVKRLLEWTTAHFGKAGVEQARLCAELLLSHVLEWQRIDLYVRFDFCPQGDALARFRELVKRAAGHEPVAYLTGKAYFYSLELAVTEAVLIPRPETELLATEAIDFCRGQTLRPTVAVLDLCTGSGCVAIALAQQVVEAEVTAVDICAEALAVAGQNVEAYELGSRISLVESDLFEGLDGAGKGVFDLIVSNPPYIAPAVYEELPVHIREYEPQQALLAEDNGLAVIGRIIEQAERYLADEGGLMLEVAYDQAEQVIALARESGYLKEVKAVRDQLGHQRVVVARKG